MDAAFFKDTFHLSTTANIPIYEQLISYFRMMIQSGELKQGDKVITEGELCRCLQISRTTVRQAMDQLTAEGLIVRYRGRGSFIASPKLHRQANYLYNFTENMHELGVIPSSRILTATVEEAQNLVKERLKLPASQSRVFHLRRLRCADNEPILLEDTFIPYYLCEGIERVDFQENSLYQILSQRYELNLYHATETIEAIVLGKIEAAQLECKPRVAGYRITRLSHLDSGYPFEFTQSVTKAERCVFQFDLYKNNNAAKNVMNFQRQVCL